MADTIDNEIAYDEQAEAFDVYDLKVVDEAEKAAARRKEKKLRFVELVMSSEEGRDFMFDILDADCHVFSENLMKDTPERNGRFEGERGVGLRLLDRIMISAPEMFWKMRCEAFERARK